MVPAFAALILSAVFFIAIAEYKPKERYGDSCPALLNATQALNSAERTFIYRCRHGDDCGGVGDRLAGAMGAAYFAVVSGRSFRIHWPGIEHVFKPGHSNWTYDPDVLGIPYKDKDGNELDRSRNHIVRGGGQVNYVLPAGAGNVVMFNDMNGREINLPAITARLVRHKHVYFHSNRSPDLLMNNFMVEKLVVKSGVVGGTTLNDSHAGHINAYRCMFNDIFQPTEAFLNTTYKSIDGNFTVFRELVDLVNRADEQSLAFHFRIDDRHVTSDSAAVTIKNDTVKWIASLGTKHQAGSGKPNLFFITNSPASARKVMEDSDIREAFGRVFSQELTGSRHINSDGAAPIRVKPPRVPVRAPPRSRPVAPRPVAPRPPKLEQPKLKPTKTPRRFFKRRTFLQTLREWWYMLMGRRSLLVDTDERSPSEQHHLRRLQEEVPTALGAAESEPVTAASLDASNALTEFHAEVPMALRATESEPVTAASLDASNALNGWPWTVWPRTNVLQLPILPRTESQHALHVNGSNPRHGQGSARHVHAVNANSSAVLSFQQAMRDWWLMRIADVLVCGKSGFCRSAGVVASEEQIKYDDEKRTIEAPAKILCTNRDCV